MRNGVNLIPRQVIDRRTRRRRVRRGLAVTVAYLVLVVAATGAYLLSSGPRAAAASTQAIVAAEQRLVALQADLNSYTRRLDDTERRRRAAEVLSQRPAWSTLLRLVAQAAGPDVLLSSVDIDSDAAGPTSGGGASVEIGGLAGGPGEAAAFVLRLEASGLFGRVELLTSRREPYGAELVTAFTVRCTMGRAQTEKGPDR